ncbi:neutral and basic amino acid transport protein rBAT-like [Ostrea edulis]|uniref:neutral and basic amino acid transport protein rBAT-like n=1 Tax=Ostrea edulis TaxID=37623 RepID=UPI0020942A5B|nr:neutral and basic amino acid transport protein rBAT-like [Ostrea edulis]
MADVNTNNEEKTPLNDAAVEPDLDPKAQFINGGKEIDPHVAIECGSGDDVSFTGLGKEELMQYADDPFWKKVRLILLIVFWAGWLAMLVAAIVIIVLAPKCPYRPDLKWYDKEAAYEIFPQSFQDSSPKPEGAAKEGDGVGDIKGIGARLDYLKKIGNKVLYINSIYESDDDDNYAVVDHKKVDTLFGTMGDFDQLRKASKKKEMRIIMDFIPNHTGKKNEWFMKSQKKEGIYKDFYVWEACDPNSGSYPNNWRSVKGGRTWTYDDTRKECYLHQLESDKPDLNLWNADVRKELEGILRFWLDKGVDGFHVLNAEYLYEDENLGDDILITGKAGNAYDDFEHNQTLNHPENLKLLSAWRSVLDSYNTKPGREKVLVVTAKDDLNTTKMYFDSGANIVRVTPMSENGASLAERIETKLMDVNSKRVGWMYSDKDSSRLANQVLPEQVKVMLTLQATLPGVPFNYYGTEIGMTDSTTLAEPKKYRTPMQWSSEGKEFSDIEPWIKMNLNFKQVNVETESAVGNDFSTLKVYKELAKLREKESFQWGQMNVFRDGNLLMYTRKAEGFPGFLVAINLGKEPVTESFHEATGIPTKVKVIFHTHSEDNTAFDLSVNSYFLPSYHAVVLEYE